MKEGKKMINKIVGLQLITREEVESIFNDHPKLPLDLIERAFEEKTKGKVLLPDKISQVFDQKTQNRINCLPATLLSQKVSGVKWVSVFPTNAEKDLLNVTGILLLSSIETGYPLAMIDGTYCTAVRTAAVGAVATNYLSRKDSKIIGFIGAGEQAQMHFKMIKTIRNIEVCYVSSRRESSEAEFVNNLKNEYPDVDFIICKGDHGKAVQNADIIVTAVSCQQPLLKAQYVKKGATYIHVGGWEDEYAVAQKADKIICDDWESVKHRSQTLSRMYYAGLLKDEDIYGNLDQIISGELVGRENEEEIIYFNSVGLAFIDVMYAYEIYEQCKIKGFGIDYRIQGKD
jgi:ornithine cyclodeaminase/alanine dehydrogenase-like protein (mu-crystallin family)